MGFNVHTFTKPTIWKEFDLRRLRELNPRTPLAALFYQCWWLTTRKICLLIPQKGINFILFEEKLTSFSLKKSRASDDTALIVEQARCTDIFWRILSFSIDFRVKSFSMDSNLTGLDSSNVVRINSKWPYIGVALTSKFDDQTKSHHFMRFYHEP